MNEQSVQKIVLGSVMVVGGGVAGIQAALDLADSGYHVTMVESEPSIGGVMAQLDKTFPTNDCAMCILSPKLVEVGRHLNIDLLTLSEVKEENPLASICGRVCHHPCESAFKRRELDQPVAIDSIKRYVADLDLHLETRFVPEI